MATFAVFARIPNTQIDLFIFWIISIAFDHQRKKFDFESKKVECESLLHWLFNLVREALEELFYLLFEEWAC